jgi:tetratricopeptide (TPR) repeat protein
LARKNLRIAQVKILLATKPSAMTHQMASLKGTFTLMGAQGKLKKDPKAALEGAEKLMAIDPLNLPFLKFFAQGRRSRRNAGNRRADAGNRPAVLAKDVVFLRLLARLYIATNQPSGAKDCYAAVAELLPQRPGRHQEPQGRRRPRHHEGRRLGRHEGDFRSKLKDKKEAILLEQQAKSVKGDSDVDTLIARTPQGHPARTAEHELPPRPRRSLRARRTLRRSPPIPRRSDEGRRPLRPADRAHHLAHQGQEVRHRHRRRQGRRRRGRRRREGAGQGRPSSTKTPSSMVKRYPNDLQFRYELGYQFYLRGQYNEAIEEFQLAQRNPQRRTRALYYLALCFTQKGQPDIAFEQLQKAASELTLMDETKKDVVYQMGVLAEQMGRKAEAVAFFKEIYSVDIKYRDITQRIEASYQK